MFKINDWISRDSKVLDLGCGDGSLLNDLRKEKSASGLGIEIDAEKIKSCLKKGISVIEQDIDSGLENFGNQSFDYVVMSQSIQALKKPEVALEEIVRIGKSLKKQTNTSKSLVLTKARCRQELGANQLKV